MGKHALTALAILCVATTSLARETIPVETVEYARSWDLAVEEGKLLRRPIVVHHHGFYCGICWRLHESILQDRDYQRFSADHIVEVISLDRLPEGVEAEERKAETYKGRRDGQEMDFLVQFAGLTVDEVVALNESKASEYNETGGVPVTTLVDPFTLDAITAWNGPAEADGIMEAVREAEAALLEAHGKGLSASAWKRLRSGEVQAGRRADKERYADALGLVDKAESALPEDAPEGALARLARLREAIAAAASARLDELEAAAESDSAAARKDLQTLLGQLDGTGLEERAQALAAAWADR